MNSQKPSVVHVIDRLHAGGAERVLTMQANLFYEKEHKVKVVTTVSEGPLRELLHKNILFECLHRKWKWNPVTMYRLVQAIKGFDVVHVHSSFNLRYLYLETRLFFYPVKIFFQEHSGKINIDKHVSPDKKFIYPKVTVISVSEEIAKWVREDAGVKPENVFVLPNIVMKQDLPVMQKEHSGRIKLLLVSNFVPSKNIEFAIGLLQKLIDDGGNYSLTITGLKADENYYNKINALVKENKLESYISIISDCYNVQPLLQQYDLAIHTTKYESGPLVLAEYMAQALPFVSYNTGQVIETIKEQMPESVVYSFDMNEWKHKIENILAANRGTLQKKLENIFSNFFSADAYYEKCVSIYCGEGKK